MRVGSLPHRTVSDKRGGELARPAVVESPEFSNGRQLKMGELERTVRNQLLKSPDCHLVQSPSDFVESSAGRPRRTRLR
jgi:hypothetical protein